MFILNAGAIQLHKVFIFKKFGIFKKTIFTKTLFEQTSLILFYFSQQIRPILIENK